MLELKILKVCLIQQWDSDTTQQFQQIATYMMHETYSTGFHMQGFAGLS